MRRRRFQDIVEAALLLALLVVLALAGPVVWAMLTGGWG